MKVHYRILLFYLLAVLFATTLLKAQTAEKIKGAVMAGKTGEPVPYAHIYYQSKSEIAISNDRGEFYLSQRPQRSDSIVISCIGYDRKKISFKQLHDAAYKISLQPGATTLNNVVITDLSARTIIERAIKSIDQFYSGRSHRLKGYFWNATKENGSYTRLQNQQIQWLYPEDVVEIKLDQTYGDRRQYKLDEINKFQETLTYEHLLSKRGFLNPDNLDMWRFSITGFRKIEGQEYYEIKATFNTTENAVDHTAFLLINAENYTLLTLDFEYKWNDRNLKRLAGFYYNFKSASGQVRFVSYNGFYFPAYVKVVIVQTVHDLKSRKQLLQQENYNEVTLTAQEINDFHPLSINAFENALQDLQTE